MSEKVDLKEFAELIKELRGDDDETLRKRAQFEAEAHAKLTRRENETHPDISVFTYPEGNRARPKPALKCKMIWCGHDESSDQLTPEEIIAYNHASPGDYRFHRTDGSEDKMIVECDRDARGDLTQMRFWYPCQGDKRHNVPSKLALLREAYALRPPEEDELLRLRAENAVLRMTGGQA